MKLIVRSLVVIDAQSCAFPNYKCAAISKHSYSFHAKFLVSPSYNLGFRDVSREPGTRLSYSTVHRLLHFFSRQHDYEDNPIELCLLIPGRDSCDAADANSFRATVGAISSNGTCSPGDIRGSLWGSLISTPPS